MTTSGDGEGSDKAERLAISRRDFEEVWGNHDLDAIDDIYAQDYRGHGFPLGLSVTRTQYRRLARAFQRAFPDCAIEPTNLTVDAEFIYADWTFTGTHTGTLFGEPPSHATVSFAGSGKHRHKDGRVREVWMDVEWPTFYRQVLDEYHPWR